MDFHLDEDLLAVQGLAREILTDRATTDRIAEIERDAGARVDDALWAELGRTGLLGIGLPEEHGGAGLGLAGLAVLLEEQGRVVAPLPLWSAGVAAAVVAAHGSAEQRATLLPAAAEGRARLTVALEEFAPAAPSAPRCRAVPDGDRWRLTGVKAAVPSPAGAAHVLVAATTDAGPGVFLVPTEGEGIAWERAETTTHDASGHLTLDGAVAEPVGEPGTDVLDRTLRQAAVALAAVQVGVADGALALAASYVTGRHQFGRPLGTFQSLQHHLANCYIDLDAMRVTLWQAVTAVEDGDGADRAALVAKWWADQGGLDIVHRVMHVHGGIGVDVDYPVHRHFLWGKQIANTLGGSAAALADLGALLVRDQPA